MQTYRCENLMILCDFSLNIDIKTGPYHPLQKRIESPMSPPWSDQLSHLYILVLHQPKKCLCLQNLYKQFKWQIMIKTDANYAHLHCNTLSPHASVSKQTGPTLFWSLIY